MSIDKEIKGFIKKLPTDITENIYILLYNENFERNFESHLIEERGEDYTNRVILINAAEFQENGSYYFNKYLYKKMFVFKENYNYIGNGYN